MIADDEARAVILDRLQGISTSAGNAKISARISQTGDFTMAKQRAAGAQHRQYHTDWEHMTDKQKFDFLYSWCHKLEATLDGRRKLIYRLNAELQKFQKKLEGEL
jgi:thymidylate synthase